MDQRSEELLRRLAMNEDAAVQATLRIQLSDDGDAGLDARTVALVRLAALVALPASPQSYEWGVSAAFAAGANDDEVVGILSAVAPVVGVARINRAAADIATAVGCELELPGRE